ncbi:transglutaminase-like cysteine peptidase [Sphingomonadaceae bacterium G21617-S1]|nr:transglutaminase-like cysteine peptidase [Sphingomonadaceae bacterium G21617-S1]
MNRLSIFKLLGLGILASLTACTTVPIGTGLRDGAPIQPPAGWVDFCRRNATDPSCDARPLNRQSWNELQGAQAQMRAIRYVPDMKNYGKIEYWQVAVTAGDCEDLALAARDRLLRFGWPVNTLRLASVFTETREKHSVLTVEVTRAGRRETLVLDSRNPQVLSWDDLKRKGYWFVTRQSGHGSAWVKIDDGQGAGWARSDG